MTDSLDWLRSIDIRARLEHGEAMLADADPADVQSLIELKNVVDEGGDANQFIRSLGEEKARRLIEILNTIILTLGGNDRAI